LSRMFVCGDFQHLFEFKDGDGPCIWQHYTDVADFTYIDKERKDECVL